MLTANLARLLAEIVGEDEALITPRTKLSREGDIKPIDVARLIIECERAFHVTIRDEDVQSFHCVRDLADYIDQQLSDGRADYKAPLDREREAWYYE